MPVVRPFRALRYSPEAVDPAAVVAPPYDVIGPDEHRRLLARHPRNVVRLDLPIAEPGDVDPDERYRRAARHLGAWRGDGTLRRDPRPTVSVLEDTFHLPGRDAVHVRRGFFARVRLEPFGAGIRAHERTLTAPKEDRYRLLRATGVNTSPVVAMYGDPSGRAAALLEAVAATSPTLDISDEAGVRHRLWPVAAGDGTAADALCDIASSATLTIADGHHRYETALRYARERRAGLPDAVELDTDDVLVLLLEPLAGPIDVLPTHRVVLGLRAEGLAALDAGLAGAFEVEAGVTAERLLGTFGPLGDAAAGAGRFGLWTRAGGAILGARRGTLAAHLPAGGAALRRLDVSLLGAAFEALVGLDAATIAEGGRIRYTMDAAEAIALVEAGTDGADAAFLLDPTPADEIVAVAADGDVMPQKSTYIYPKALTGLVINPLEG
ncbi:MAG: DUF1015 domain-containing protein [Chloroflexota bacterium]